MPRYVAHSHGHGAQLDGPDRCTAACRARATAYHLIMTRDINLLSASHRDGPTIAAGDRRPAKLASPTRMIRAAVTDADTR